MNNFKKAWKKFWAYVWELFKQSIPTLIMFCCASSVLMLLTLKEEIKWDDKALAWTIVCGLAACAYAALVMWGCGGNQYEMLVSGNMKRVSAMQYGSEYKISSHKEVKEYRPWKGFAIGGFSMIFTILFGIVFGCCQARIDAGQTGGFLSIVAILAFFLSGWSILPFYYMNVAGGFFASYFLSLLFVILPVAVSGAFYIIGAYGRRNKAIREQELADQAAAAAAAKPKKINYGGLPGTKPKKRKK